MKLLRITTIPLSLKYLLKGQLKHFSSLGYSLIAVSADGPEVQEIEAQEGVRHQVIPLSRKITPLQDLFSLFKLYRFIRKEKPDIVHSHTPKAGLIAMMAAFLARVPVRMHTVAGLPLMESKGAKRTLLIAVEKITYAFSTKVYPNSFAMKKFIEQEFYQKPDKMKVLGNGSSNGIDTNFFMKNSELVNSAGVIRKEHVISETDKVAVFVGRVTGDKGINELVRAIKKVPSLKLLLVGPMEADLDPLDRDVSEEIDANDNIIWVGFQADVRPYLVASDFLVFPSYREGFPNVPMQAGALGLPCIVTDINGCNEIIEDKVNGLIIPVKNELALTNSINQIIENSDLYAKMKKNARPMIVERYSQRVLWEALELEYEKLYNDYV